MKASLPTLLIKLAENNPKAFWSAMLLPTIVGLFTQHFIGGRVAFVAGSIQAAFVIFVIYYLLILIMYREYKSESVSRFMSSFPIKLVRVLIFIVLSFVLVFAFYSIAGGTV